MALEKMRGNVDIYYIAEGSRVRGPFVESQLLTMWRSGSITAAAQASLGRSEVWVPLIGIIDEFELRDVGKRNPIVPPVPPPAAAAPKYANRVRREQNGCLRFGLILFGIVGLFFYLIPGLILFALAAMIPSGSWTCGACGNDIAATSALCPACGAILGEKAKRDAETMRAAGSGARVMPQVERMVVPKFPEPAPVPAEPRKPNRFWAWLTKVK